MKNNFTANSSFIYWNLFLSHFFNFKILLDTLLNIKDDFTNIKEGVKVNMTGKTYLSETITLEI